MLLIWSLTFRLTTLAFKNFYLKLFRSYSIKRQGTFSQLISGGLDWTLAWINGWIHHFLVYNKQLVNSANWDVFRRIVPTLLKLTCRYLICNFHWWRDQLFRKSCSRSVRQITSWQQTGNEFFLKKSIFWTNNSIITFLVPNQSWSCPLFKFQNFKNRNWTVSIRRDLTWRYLGEPIGFSA